jgi:endonuclease/exonuclease/phosphatase family metal-dependent hydrolase
VIRLISWNVHQLRLWDELASSDADVALLQEVHAPIGAGFEVLPGGTDTWATAGWEIRPWRTAIARLSDNVRLEPIISGDISGPDSQLLPVSRSGTIAAARVWVDERHLFTAASVYAPWEQYFGAKSPIWADGSAHRILSDLAPLLWNPRRDPMVVAGDWNILRGYGEHGAEYNKHRYESVFTRADALGLAFVGPEYPNGRRADPRPSELPEHSTCVPTFHHGGQTPETATRQLDFVFASKLIADRVSVRALNDPAEWGRSDHCRIVIDIDV